MAEQGVSITFQTSAKTRELLDEIARNTGHRRTYVINEALRSYLTWHRREKELMSERIAAADRGELIDHEQVFDDLERDINDEVNGREHAAEVACSR